MVRLAFFVILSTSFLLAQSDTSNTTSKENSDASKGTVTVQGCVDRSRGDYILVKQNPPVTYELQGTGKTKLRDYLGQRVEVTGTKATSQSTSSDAIAFGGSPAPVTIKVNSIKTLAKECSERAVPSH
jgi:hypothetical protein